MPSSSLSSSRLFNALHRLARHAAAEKIVIELGLCHGRVIAVCHDESDPARTRAQPVDTARRIIALAHLVADEEKLPDNWLKNDLKYYLAFFAARKRANVDVFKPNLIISLTESGRLLALKLRACQANSIEATDLDDLAFLIVKMGLDSQEAVEKVFRQFWPDESLGPDLQRIVARLSVGQVNRQ